MALYIFFGAFLLILGAGMAVVWEIHTSRPTFDRADPDYGAFAERFAQAARALDDGRAASVNLAPATGGAWRTACLFGGYTWPIEEMERRGASIRDADRQSLAEPGGLRLTPVEEHEVLVSIVDEAGNARFIHFDHGLNSHGQHFQACVTRPETFVTIDAATGTYGSMSRPAALPPWTPPRTHPP
ncbi:hypothetical protein F1193_06050 [Blastochloris sulfoviridis]|uniref:Uncharacterized protein n=2 Tax=Blastochloris sulfoviridis TaxID=50712 RepID=A0A5M6I222_9HYPH|nr:hypothetical protein F1193_06050 [Blastochloris sulfoviridis]